MNTQVQRAEHFIVLTLNHNTVSLQELPKYTLTCNQVEEFLREFSQDPQVEEIVGLCTCNRIEFYAMVHSVKDASHQLARRIGEKAGCAFDQLMNKMDVCVDEMPCVTWCGWYVGWTPWSLVTRRFWGR